MPLNCIVAMEDNNINFDDAKLIGQATQITHDGSQFLICRIKYKGQIQILSCLQDTVKIGDDTIHLKPEVLFNRLTLLAQKEKEQTQYF